MSTEYKKLYEIIDELEREIKKSTQDIKQLYTNQANLNNRITVLETNDKRNSIIKDLCDVSKTGKSNYTIQEIAEKNNITEYEVRKIQKEEGLFRNTNGNVNKK